MLIVNTLYIKFFVTQSAIDLLKGTPAPQLIMYTQDLSDLFLPRALVVRYIIFLSIIFTHLYKNKDCSVHQEDAVMQYSNFVL